MCCDALEKNDARYSLLATVVLLDLILTGKFLQKNNPNVILYIAVFGVAAFLLVFVAWCFSKLSALSVFAGLLILSPPVLVVSTLPSIRFDEVMLVLLLIRLLCEDPYGFIKENVGVGKLFFFIVVYGLISILYSFLFLGYIPSVGDFFEVARFIEYAIVVMVAKTIVLDASREEVQNFFDSFIFFFFVFILFCFYQFFNFFYFNGNISFLYTHELHVYALNKYRRIIGTVANPNSAGLFLNIIFFYMVCRLFFFRRNEKKGIIWVEVFLAVVSFIALLCTLSRTNILANFMCAAWLVFKSQKRVSPWMKKRILILFFAAVTFIAIFFAFDESFRIRMLSGLYLTHDRSLLARFQRWGEVLQEIAKSPLFGWGPAKNVFDIAPPVDNEYLLILRKYGIIGFGFYVFSYYLIYKEASAAEKLKDIRWLGLFEKCTLLSVIINNITGGVMYHLQIMPFLLLMVAFISGMRRLLSHES